ncbi:MAG: hypothetical protein LUE24_13810 [Lachnospiraceae bacterium]|nr:hypothetical protein [Lachnospiraceae bacterium]
MKQAYKNYLYMAREGDWIYVAGSYWEASIREDFLPKKTKGDMIALAGDLPMSGERRRMNKEEDQFETGFRINVDIEPFQKYHQVLEVTDLILLGGGVYQRILQSPDTGSLYLINDVFVNLVDNSQAMVENGEIEVGTAPFYTSTNGVLWMNNVCRLHAAFRSADGKMLDAMAGCDLMPEIPE